MRILCRLIKKLTAVKRTNSAKIHNVILFGKPMKYMVDEYIKSLTYKLSFALFMYFFKDRVRDITRASVIKV